MLVARSQAVLYRSALRCAFAFGRGIWCKLVDQDRLAYDTRFLPGASGAPKPRVCLYLLGAGSLEMHGRVVERFDAPVAIAMTLDQLEGAHERRALTLRASGARCSVIEIHLDAAAFTKSASLPERIDLPDSVWAWATRALANFHEDEQRAEMEVVGMLRELASSGLVDAEAVGRAIAPMPAVLDQLWRGLRPVVERKLLSATTEEIAEGAGVTRRRVEQGMQYFIASTGLVGSGIRVVMNRLRLKAGVIFLSSEEGSVAEVARLAGYGSADAMGRAFRDAGLPSPTVVRQELARIALAQEPTVVISPTTSR
jgi:hypothetical protein